ncbi:MAG: GAF and ANTAR domain-containing protein [Acidimicrobiales bacterium]
MEDLPSATVEKLAQVNKLLKTKGTLPDKLEAVVALVKRTVPGCDAAGVCLLVDGEPTSVAVSDRLAMEIDLVQYRTGEGPCLAAIGTSQVVRIDVLERDTRFIHFAPGALDLELRSVLSMPLSANGRTVGALNIYSRRPDAFDAQSEVAAQPLADHAAEVISASAIYAYSLDMVDGLTESIESQALIYQATGVLMATEERTSAEALDRLRQLAMRSGESMRTVATWVIEERTTGTSSIEGDELR